MTAQATQHGGTEARWAIALGSLGAGVVTSGIQGVSPALPAIQAEFGLGTAQIALISSVYLFPSIFSALGGGALADRIGVRPVYAGSLLLYALGGFVLLFAHTLPVLLAVRFVQGAAFGTVLALSVSIIGLVARSGVAGARGQARRSVAMASGEAVFPVLAGLLLMLSWYAPFAMQILALPLAVLAWFKLPNSRTPRKKGDGSGIGAVVSAPAFVSVQALGALRFVVKFAVLTFYPILAVNEIGLSAAFVGIALGVSAVLTALASWFSEKLAARWSAVHLLGGCLVLVGISLTIIAFADNPAIVVAALLIFGFQDGVASVAHNVLVTEMAPERALSTYAGTTVTIRNVGKFAAPLIFAGATVFLSLSHSFLVLAGIGLVSLSAVARVSGRQRRMGLSSPPKKLVPGTAPPVPDVE